MTARAGGTILVVEDDPGIAALERRRLERVGYTVVSAAGTAAAEAALAAHPIELLLLDYTLPGERTGLDFYRDLRAAGHDLPVIMVTGSSDEAMVVAALRAGVRDFVTKSPTYLSYLPDAVARTLAQVRTERALGASEARFRAMVQHSSDIVALFDATGRVRYVSPAVGRVLGYPAEQVARTSPRDLLHPDDAPRIAEHCAAALARPGLYPTVGCQLRHADGSWRQVEIIGNNLLHDPDIGSVVVTIHDVTERAAFEAQLAHQAFHDALTGLPNRTLFHDRLSQALTRGARERAVVGVLLLDLDGFKYVNDSLGHDAGDHLLVSFARRLPGRCLRPGDTVARLGGDEFVILLESLSGPGEAARIAERLATCPALWAPYSLEGREVIVRASFGVAVGRAGALAATDLLRDADTALYRAKAAGRGGYAIFDPQMNAAASARLALETDLRQALGRGEMEVHYQPLVTLADGHVARAEALLRWRHPVRGLILPAAFVPLAEETGLVRPLGRWVLAEACRQAVAWRQAHGAVAPIVCVNLSAREFNDPELVATVARTLDDTGLPPGGLELELTEGVLLGDTPGTLDTLQRLHNLGVELAVDDFGTGYSSLAYLKHFPVDTLKVDRAFIAGLGAESEDIAIVGAVIGLAHALGLATVAEGVETAEQCAAVRALGCTLAQGYFFAPPLPAGALDALLADGGRLALPPGTGRRAPNTGELRQRRAARPERTRVPAAERRPGTTGRFR